jgi:hypothetical protein
MPGGENSSEAGGGGAKQHQQGSADGARTVHRDFANTAQTHLGVAWIMYVELDSCCNIQADCQPVASSMLQQQQQQQQW